MKTTLDELLAFKTVVDTGSISAAAERLEQTSSGISRALSRLEQKLNTTLMRRTTRRLELSEEGRLFLARAREILQSVEAAEDDDLRIQADGQTALIDPVSVPFLKNSEIAYVDELAGAQFVVRNPNAASSCGCGVSFSI